MRTSSVELPSASELRTMIRQESPRLAWHQDYLDARPRLFAELKRIAHNAGIDTAVFDHYAVYDFDDTISKLHRFTTQLADYLAQHAHHSEAATLYEVLAKGNPPRRSDVMLVFGSAENRRIATAVELYHAGVAPKITIAGASPRWAVAYSKDTPVAEAWCMAEYALTHGVPARDIIIEDQSISIPDNVKRSIDCWEAMLWCPRRIILVTSEFNVRRAEMNLYKFAPWPVEIFTASPEPSPSLRVNTWIATDRGRRLILNEYAKIIIESTIDHLLAAEKGV